MAKQLGGIDLNDFLAAEQLELPNRYAKVFRSFQAAYQRVDTKNESKKLRWIKTIELKKQKGVTVTQISKALNIDVGNINAYLKHGEIDRLSLEKATKIMKYLYSL